MKFIYNIYILLAIFNFILSGIFILGLRLELFRSGLNLFLPEFNYSLITLHGLLMIFGFTIPIFSSINNIFYINIIYNRFIFSKLLYIFSFFLFILSEFIILIINFLPLGYIISGWTIYIPLIFQLDYNFDLFLISIIILNISFFFNSLNNILTIFKYNNFKKKSIYILTLILTNYLIIISSPILIGLVLLIILDKYYNTFFFYFKFKGDVLFFQHMFWFFGHPEVYIIILPCFGITSYIISTFCKKKLYGYNIMNYTLISITVLSLIVWGHHMFIVGLPLIGNLFFMYCTLLISIPTGIKLFNWLYTLFNSYIVLNISLRFSIIFLYFFILGGFSGIILSLIPLNYYYHGTYFVVAHFHYIMVSCIICSIISLFYYLLPIIYNIKYNIKCNYHFWFLNIFLNLTFFPMHILGFKSMPRRYIDYNIKYIFYNKYISFSYLYLIFSNLYFFYYIIKPILKWKN